MKVKVVVHAAEEGGFWAEVPALPGCVTQGETIAELMDNVHDAIEGWMSVDVERIAGEENAMVMEIAV